VGTKCTNHVANRCTGSCLARRQTRVNFLNGRNFMVVLTNLTKQIQNKYCCNSSNEVQLFDNSDVKESVPKWLRQRSTTANSNMAAQTGNTYISGTMRDSVEIPTEILGFSTMSSSNKVFLVYAAILPFLVVGRCRNHFLWTRHVWKLHGKTPGCSWKRLPMLMQLNPRIALLFLRTCVALGVKKPSRVWV